MTHEDLLAKIQSNVDFLKTQCYEGSLIGGFVVTDALRAVVELHPMWTDYKYTETDKELVEFCGCCQEKYPCPTIQAIEKELA